MDNNCVHFMHFLSLLFDIFIQCRTGYGIAIQKDFIYIRQVNSSHPNELYPERMCVSLHKSVDEHMDSFLELMLEKYSDDKKDEDIHQSNTFYGLAERKAMPRYRVNSGYKLIKLHRTVDNDFLLKGKFCFDGYLIKINPLKSIAGMDNKGREHYIIFHDKRESDAECLHGDQDVQEDYVIEDSEDTNYGDLKSQEEDNISPIEITDAFIDTGTDTLLNDADDSREVQYTLDDAFGNSVHAMRGNGRVRRTHQLTIELLMVIDYAAYKWWQSVVEEDKIENGTDAMTLIRQFYAFIFQGIDARFMSIEKQPYMIDLAFSGLFVAKTEQESYWTTESIIGENVDNGRVMVNSSEALDKFQKWLDNADFLPPYDHAILFTGTNLTYAGSPGNTGLAFESSMCRNISNASIVEDIFDFRTITYSTQQIARSLGSRDDMDNNNCLEFFNHIMVPKFKLPIRSFVSNRWKFSSCSEQYFLEYTSELNDFGLTCLNEKFSAERYPQDLAKLVEHLPGQVYGGKRQCENRFGLMSDICRESIGTSYADICTGLLCTLPGLDSCDFILPADGTPCGSKKYCWHGSCLEFEDAVESSDTCVFGDDPESHCEVITVENRSQCYNESTRYKCCQACESVLTGIPTCEYGDRSDDCSMNRCINGDDSYKIFTCCLTCSDGPTPYSPPANKVVTEVFPLQQTHSPPNSDISKTSTVPISQTITPSSILNAISSLAAFVEASVSENISSTVSASIEIATESFENKIKAQSGDVFDETLSTTTEVLHDKIKEHHEDERRKTPKTEIFTTIQTPMNFKSPENQYGDTFASDQSLVQKESRDTNTKVDFREQTTTTVSYIEADRKSSNTYTSKENRCDCTTTLLTDQNTTPEMKTPGHTSDSTVQCEPPKYIETGYASLYDRIFFKDLARSMQNNQRHIKQTLRANIQSLYGSITKKLRGSNREYETENESGREGSEDENLNHKLLPIWRQHYHDIIKDAEKNVREMRYRVLALLNRHFKYRSYRHW